ncbi:hypothetical protein SLEP1_g4622 [Rubroshorea leprosula]|uniref:Complex III subunit VI n=1 Tax=Rubroshorea leprosula TaxID=152421 RepID=A0AAV5I030_9ROSI|nr:hypothetical protein SLEP1_g4622 [Rubroshorea leprosula]
MLYAFLHLRSENVVFPTHKDQSFIQSLLHSQREIKKQIWHRLSAVSGTTFISMADGKVIDPKIYLEESCKPKCVKSLIEYGGCVKRIDGDDTGSKHCTGQYFDYLSCVDKCGSLIIVI